VKKRSLVLYQINLILMYIVANLQWNSRSTSMIKNSSTTNCVTTQRQNGGLYEQNVIFDRWKYRW
jgi:hypothetical protein